jgi:prepilin-type N-terminal cleavage/methylation domain-containing protein
LQAREARWTPYSAVRVTRSWLNSDVRATRWWLRSEARATRSCASFVDGGPRRARGGFTILEVLLAMAILLLGMTAVLGLLTFGAALSRTALLRTTSAAAVEATVADLEETLFPMVDGEAGPPIEIKERALPGLPDVVYTASAHENPQHPLEYKVDIEMSWKSAGVQREKRFSTLLLREIPFGERLRKRFVEGVKDETRKVPLPEDAPKK